VPVGEQRVSGFHVGPHQRLDRNAELSGMAARRMRPTGVSRYFARFRLGFAWLVPHDHLDGIGDEDLPGFGRIEKVVVGPEGFRLGRPRHVSSGSRGDRSSIVAALRQQPGVCM